MLMMMVAVMMMTMMTMVITMMMMIAKVMSLPYMGFLLSESGFIPAPGGELPTLLYSVSFLTCTPMKKKKCQPDKFDSNVSRLFQSDSHLITEF